MFLSFMHAWLTRGSTGSMLLSASLLVVFLRPKLPRLCDVCTQEAKSYRIVEVGREG